MEADPRKRNKKTSFPYLFANYCEYGMICFMLSNCFCCIYLGLNV